MKLRLLGKDSDQNDSPALYATDRGTYVIQGWKVTDPGTLSQMKIPFHETCIEVPMELMRYLQAEPSAGAAVRPSPDGGGPEQR